jgi:hypothetical protein
VGPELSLLKQLGAHDHIQSARTAGLWGLRTALLVLRPGRFSAGLSEIGGGDAAGADQTLTRALPGDPAQD